SAKTPEQSTLEPSQASSGAFSRRTWCEIRLLTRMPRFVCGNECRSSRFPPKRTRMWRKQLWVRKSFELLAAEMAGEHRLKRVLGPVSLTSLGVGAIIGAGIFVVTGRAAALDAGPAIIIS